MNLLMGDAIMDQRQAKLLLPESPIELVIVTRFNIYLSQYTSGLSEQDRRLWSERRLELFRRVCVRSVRWQSVPDFSWLVLCDAEQEEMAREVEAVIRGAPGAHVVRCARQEDANAVIRGAVNGFVSGLPENGRKLVCTARLDCDDALNRHYASNLHTYARWFFGRRPKEVPVCFSFSFGAQMEEDRFLGLTFPHNPFIALIEDREAPLKTVYFANHGRIHDKVPVQFLQTRQPMWLQVVHGENVMNSIFQGAVPLSLDALAQKKMFGLMPSRARPVTPTTPR